MFTSAFLCFQTRAKHSTVVLPERSPRHQAPGSRCVPLSPHSRRHAAQCMMQKERGSCGCASRLIPPVTTTVLGLEVHMPRCSVALRMSHIATPHISTHALNALAKTLSGDWAQCVRTCTWPGSRPSLRSPFVTRLCPSTENKHNTLGRSSNKRAFAPSPGSFPCCDALLC